MRSFEVNIMKIMSPVLTIWKNADRYAVQNKHLTNVFRLIISLIILGSIFHVRVSFAEPSFAFFYATNPPVDELKAFDIVVVDPAGGISPSTYGTGRSELFAYVSVGETNPGSGYAGQVRDSWVLGRNKAWGSMVMDTSSASWRRFYLEKVITPLWQAGYRGFFLDTLDSYRMCAGKDRYGSMEDGIVALVRDIRKNCPGVRLIFNRGFEVIDRLRPDVFAVAAESLFRGYSPEKGGYYEVDGKERAWLTGKLKLLKKEGIPVISIDYLPPGKRDRARETAGKIRALGFIPWVTDKDLSSLGVGAVEVMPRKILALYDGTEVPDRAYSKMLRFAAMPLNYMGYALEFHDMRKPLPDPILEGRYAGVVVWPASDSSAGPGFRKWLSKTISEGVRVAFLDYFGIPLSDIPAEMGIGTAAVKDFRPPLRVTEKDGLMGFEVPPPADARLFSACQAENGKGPSENLR